MIKKMASLFFAFFVCISVFAKGPTDTALEQKMGEFLGKLAGEIRDNQVQYGTSQVAQLVRDYSINHASDIEELKNYFAKESAGSKFVVYVGERESAIDSVNSRFQEAGWNFIRVEKDPNIELGDPGKPLPDQAATYAKWKIFRVIAAPTIQVIGGIAGGASSGHMGPSLITGGTGSVLEIQFGAFSGWWREHVWIPFGVKANIIANISYAGILLAADAIGAKLFGIPFIFSAPQFGVKVVRDTATFVGSAGLAQMKQAGLKAKGSHSELGAFIAENKLMIAGGFLRMIAIAAQVFSKAKIATSNWGILEPFNFHNFSLGQWIGYGGANFIALTLTAPLVINAMIGDKKYDQYSDYLQQKSLGLPHQWDNKPITRTCAAALSWLSATYSVTKRALPNRSFGRRVFDLVYK